MSVNDDIRGSVIRLGELVDIQPGAVVSREVMRKQSGTVTVFSFDRGQGLSEHTAPFDALVEVLEGSLDITISGRLHHLESGDSIIMPADMPHALSATMPTRMLLTLLRE